MTDYTELVKSLRMCRFMDDPEFECVEFVDGSCEAFPVCAYCLMGKAADAIEELSKPRWISVKDRLPEKAGTYLIVTNKGNVMSDSYAPIFRRFNGNAGRHCTNWMPLPEPPEEEA